MKKLLIYCCCLLLVSCASNKNFLERTDADKALQDAVKRLNKKESDENALQAIPILYNKNKEAHLANIAAYNNSNDVARWDKILKEYGYLQNAYEAILQSSAAFRLVSPNSYSAEILEAKQNAASEFYKQGLSYYDKPGKENARQAFSFFKKADSYIPGFKDSKNLLRQSYQNAIVNVLINPVQDNSFFFNSGWGNYGYNYSNEYFQQTLVRELSNNGDRYPAKFYTDWEARRSNVQPDWVVDLQLRNMDVPYPISNYYSRNVSSRVQVGTDTAGHPLYNTVYATLNINRQSFTARADMEVNIRDLHAGKNISYRTFREDYRWEQETAQYSGDSRALSARDWQLVNGSQYGTPKREDVLNELYRKLYPQVRNEIAYAVDW